MPEDAELGADSARPTAAAPTEDLRAAEPVRFTPGALLAGRYRLIAPLGKGGMGEVYRADDTRLGQPVALKFLPAVLAADASRLQRLEDEVRIGRQISHPNVCRLYDIAEAEGHHFVVMEYVDGEDLASLLRRIGRLSGDKALEIARGMCAGLAAAHDKGVIHRDLKPANVMIDGRGHARIADFGLAALVERGKARDLSGTPAYMAPEQLAGEGATLRSDVFALGLVLFEMLSGRRLFHAGSLDELRALHAEWKSFSLSSSAKDVDPALERVVQRCLSRDPKDRPDSARSVLAMLPGGDPLQAAVLAGETPSPEMVAAASKVGDLPAGHAWFLLGYGLASLLAVAALSPRVSLFGLTPLPNAPEVLAARAREIPLRLGYPDDAADSKYGFLTDSAFLDDIEKRDTSPTRWDKLKTARPGPLSFYYRQSPRPLISGGWIVVLPWIGPPELGRITRDTPPLNVPGMIDVVLDPRGRLLGFAAVPPRVSAAATTSSEPDWSTLLVEAGFDAKDLRPSSPRWSAPVDSDRKAAWDGAYASQPDVRFHIEAASYRGLPVYFDVQGPWRRPSPVVSDRSWLNVARVIIYSLLVPFVWTGIVLVRRNIRLGRSDRRGAFRLGLITFASLTLADLVRADHTSVADSEYALLLAIVSQGCYGALALWSLYMALEPSVRRRWPHALISWSRAVEGRFMDPLVARDVLVGVLLGILMTGDFELGFLVPAWLGRAPSIGLAQLSALNSPRHVLFYLLLGVSVSLLRGVAGLYLLYLARALVRHDRAARWLVFLFFATFLFAASDTNLLGLAVTLIYAGIFVVSITRFGLFTSAVMTFTSNVLFRTPLTLDPSAWYAGRSFAVLALFTVLLVYGFYGSLGSKPMFGRALLED